MSSSSTAKTTATTPTKTFFILGMLLLANQVHHTQAGPITTVGCLLAVCSTMDAAMCIQAELHTPLAYAKCLLYHCGYWKSLGCSTLLALPSP